MPGGKYLVLGDCAKGWGHTGAAWGPEQSPLLHLGLEQITLLHHSMELLTRIKPST